MITLATSKKVEILTTVQALSDMSLYIIVILKSGLKRGGWNIDNDEETLKSRSLMFSALNIPLQGRCYPSCG